ncbi:MAG: IS630 family transposase [Stellaceae bacterium]
MGKSYSMDLRERVVFAIEDGMSTRAAAARFSIGIATAGTWSRLKRATGAARPAKQGKPKGSVLDAHADFILGVLEAAPDTTLDEMVERLRDERAITVVRTAVWKFLDRRGQTHKKKTAHASEQERPDVKAAREDWFDSQTGLDPERLIFIDESGLSTKMARRRGWAPKGERCRAAIPHGHWKTITFVGGLTLKGFVAPMLLDGPMNGECLLAWVEQMLAPTLRPGDIVIMDNLPAHKVAGVRQAIEAKAAGLLYLPPYSPDFNPIETAFAKLKAHVRKAAARTYDAREHAAAHALTMFSTSQCTNFFAHAGYDLN